MRMRLIRTAAWLCAVCTVALLVVARPAAAATSISITVEKTNDADGDGVFHQSEGAKAAGADVPFRVSVTNGSTVAVVINNVTDTDSNGNKAAACASLSNASVQPGASLVCRFTATAYSPAAGGLVTDTIEVTASEAGAPDNKTTSTSASSVTVAAGAATAGGAASKSLKIVEEGQPGTTTTAPATPSTQANPAKLARTGRDTSALVWLAVLLLGLGALVLGVAEASDTALAPER